MSSRRSHALAAGISRLCFFEMSTALDAGLITIDEDGVTGVALAFAFARETSRTRGLTLVTLRESAGWSLHGDMSDVP